MLRPNYSKPCLFFIQTTNPREDSIIIVQPNGKAERMYLNTTETPDDPFILSFLSKRDPKETIAAFKNICTIVEFLGVL
jgi:hypothetical protein